MLRIIQTLSAVGAAGLVAGCSKTDESATSSNTSQRANSEENRALAPSSRDADSPNRLYSSETNSSTSSRDADNTGRNVRDRSDATLTPGDQGSSESDREITRRIRRALTTNDQFSTIAKNIKIITVDGKVTLRGPVKSPEEQQAVISAAQGVAGQSPVDNQLEVKAVNQ